MTSEHVVTGEGPAVLLIHGAGGTPESAFPFMPELAESHRVIAPSLEALDVDPLDGVDAVAEGIHQLLERWDVTGCAVVGYSLGAAIATAVADRAADRVQALMLVAGFARPRASLLVKLQVWERLMRRDSAGAYLASTIYSDATLAGWTAEQVAEEAAAIDESLQPATLEHIRLIRDTDVSDALRRVRCPVSLLVPDADGLVDPAHSRDLHALRPDAVVLHLPASHAVARELPMEYRLHVESFIADASSRYAA